MDEIRFMMVVEKQTDNTKRFEEVPAPGARQHVGKLYVSKASLKELGNPQGIEVIIRAVGTE